MTLIVRRIDQQAEYQEKEIVKIPAGKMPVLLKLTNELESAIEQIAADRVQLNGAPKRSPKKVSPKKKATKKPPAKRKRG